MSQLTLYNAASPVRAPRKAGAWTKLGRFRTAQWPRAAPLGETLQRRLRLLHSAFCLLPFPFPPPAHYQYATLEAGGGTKCEMRN
jgi:hypothetical protein